jgi:hypothetical protein
MSVYAHAGILETCGGIAPSFWIALKTNVVSRSGGSHTALEAERYL